MPSIIQPGRWRRQPQTPVKVRGAFAAGHVFSAASGLLSSRGALLTSAGVSRTATTSGLAWATDGSTVNNLGFSAIPQIAPPWTYLIRLRRRAAQDDARLHGPTTGSDAAVISCSVGGSGTLDVIDFGTAWKSLGSLADVLPVGEFRTLVLSMDAAKVIRAFSGGRQHGSATILASTYLNLAGAAFVGSQYAGGYGAAVQWDITEIAILPVALDAAEALALSADIYGELFTPRRQILYFPGAAGGASPQTIAVGLSTETDSALGMTALPGAVTEAAGLAAETDSALGMTASPGVVATTVGLVAETDTAFSITPYTGQLITLGLVTELDSAQAITVGPGAVTYPVGLVSESDLALDITASSSGSVSLSEADIAAIWDHEIMSGVSARLAMKVLMAGIVGKREGLGTEMELYYDLDGTTVRITFSPTDEAGNGTPIVDGS